MRIIKNHNYWYSAGYLVNFFAAWSLWWSFYAIWLKTELGLSGYSVGMVYSINSAISMIFMIIYGILQDKMDIKKWVITFQGVVLALTGPFLVFAYEPLLKSHFILGVILGAIFLSAGFISGCALLESYVERISRRFNFEYGQCRFWGSLGYAAATFLAGLLFGINPHINFWLSSILGILFLIINFIYTPSTMQGSVELQNKNTSIPALSEILSLLKLKNFWFFVIFVIGTMSFYNIYDQQLFPNFYTTFFATSEDGYKTYGYLNSFQVFLESAMMIVTPFLIYKIGPKNALLIAALIMLARMAGSATIHNIYIISLIKLLHAIEIPLFVLSMFKYIVTNFDPRFSATMYLIGYKISISIGVIILSTPVGILFDKFGFSPTFYFLSIIVLAITLVSFITLSNKKIPNKNN